jgi:hypothetical protein
MMLRCVNARVESHEINPAPSGAMAGSGTLDRPEAAVRTFDGTSRIKAVRAVRRQNRAQAR